MREGVREDMSEGVGEERPPGDLEVKLSAAVAWYERDFLTSSSDGGSSPAASQPWVSHC